MTAVRRIVPLPARPCDAGEPPSPDVGKCLPELVWYAAYGSNLDAARLRCYLAGGRPPGAARAYPGCRDRRPPRCSVPVELRGALYFATRSPVWGGGRAFYDPDATGRVLARAHLITSQQFSDLAAQEMYRTPGRDLDLGPALAHGRHVLGSGRYETLLCPGALEGRPGGRGVYARPPDRPRHRPTHPPDGPPGHPPAEPPAGVPVLTFTAPWRLPDVTPVPPSAAYLRHLVVGLRAAGAWDMATIAHYLAHCTGAYGHWTSSGVAALAGDGSGDVQTGYGEAPSPPE